MTWSMRRPPPAASVARIASTNGWYPASASRHGMNGGRPQSCPRRLNSSGGAPTLTPAASRSCHIQASAPPGSTPIGRSWISEISVGHLGHLTLHQPLQPGEEPHGVGLLGGERGHVRAVRAGVRGGPPAPVRARSGRRARSRCANCRTSSAFAYQVTNSGSSRRSRADLLQGGALEPPHLVAVDPAVVVEAAPGLGQRRQRRADVGRAGHVLDPQVDRVREAPRGGRVRAGLLRHGRRHRVQGVDEDEVGAQVLAGPPGQATQVAEVAHAPALARPRRVQLRGPAPAAAGGEATPPGADDDRAFPLLTRQRVVTQGQVGRQRLVDLDPGAVLERQHPGRGRLLAGADHERAPCRAARARRSARGGWRWSRARSRVRRRPRRCSARLSPTGRCPLLACPLLRRSAPVPLV